jgi:transposase
MSRLTEVQRGQAIALLMQGQRQQQAALQFGVNVSTVERLVRRLRDTRRVVDRPRRGRPRITKPRQDRAICLAHLRNRHVTATETALTTDCARLISELVDFTLVFLSFVNVARIVWLGWRHMVP